MLPRVSTQSVKGLGIFEALKNLTSTGTNRLRFTGSKTIKCWKCGAQKSENLFCEKCSVLQEPSKNSTYFEVLGLEKNYNIKVDDLTKKFKRMQNLLHPDRFGTKEKDEMAVSENYSALVNEAYSTLQSPLERGLYLLQLEGLSIEEGAVQSDPAFLADMMERNEELETAADSQQEVLRLATENRRVLEALAREVGQAFESRNLPEAQLLLSKMKYYSSLEEKIKEAKQRLGIVL